MEAVDYLAVPAANSGRLPVKTAPVIVRGACGKVEPENSHSNPLAKLEFESGENDEVGRNA